MKFMCSHHWISFHSNPWSDYGAPFHQGRQGLSGAAFPPRERRPSFTPPLGSSTSVKIATGKWHRKFLNVFFGSLVLYDVVVCLNRHIIYWLCTSMHYTNRYRILDYITGKWIYALYIICFFHARKSIWSICNDSSQPSRGHLVSVDHTIPFYIHKIHERVYFCTNMWLASGGVNVGKYTSECQGMPGIGFQSNRIDLITVFTRCLCFVIHPARLNLAYFGMPKKAMNEMNGLKMFHGVSSVSEMWTAAVQQQEFWANFTSFSS